MLFHSCAQQISYSSTLQAAHFQNITRGPGSGRSLHLLLEVVYLVGRRRRDTESTTAPTIDRHNKTIRLNI